MYGLNFDMTLGIWLTFHWKPKILCFYLHSPLGNRWQTNWNIFIRSCSSEILCFDVELFITSRRRRISLRSSTENYCFVLRWDIVTSAYASINCEWAKSMDEWHACMHSNLIFVYNLPNELSWKIESREQMKYFQAFDWWEYSHRTKQCNDNFNPENQCVQFWAEINGYYTSNYVKIR